MDTLFSAEVEVDHIIPYSLSLDDSYMNKVVCFTEENRNKGQRTPFDAFSNDEEKWCSIVKSIDDWGRNLGSKKDRFFKKEGDLTDMDFVARQLVDTRYVSRLALSYLKPLGADITTSKGIITGWIRHQWGLNNLIGKSKDKDRIDHRHHIIDAMITACVDRRFYNILVKSAKEHEKKHAHSNLKELCIDPPWEELRSHLAEKLDGVVVVHEPIRKINGALHEETGVGYIEGIGTVTRKVLDPQFKKDSVKKIYDDCIRDIIYDHLAKYENDPKKAFNEGVVVYHKDGKTPIKRVRIKQSPIKYSKLTKNKFGIKDKDGKAFKWHAYGNIHHVEVVKNTKKDGFEGRLITMMEASHRAKGIGMKKQSMVNKNHGEDFKFVIALHKNDLVQIKIDGEYKIYRVRKLGTIDSGSNPRITLNLHIDAKDKIHEIEVSISNLMTQYQMQLLRVNCLGKVILQEEKVLETV